MPEPAHQPLSEILREIAAQPGSTVTMGELMDRFGARAMGAMLLLFGLACTLPLPPGGTTIFGAPLLLLAPQLAFGARAPWIPARLRERPIAAADLRRGLPRVLRWMERLEAISRPRLTFLFGPLGERLAGLVCIVLALVLILPIPLGNLLPAAAVSVLALALVQRDGALALFGYGLAALSAAVLALAAGLIGKGLHHAISFITSA